MKKLLSLLLVFTMMLTLVGGAVALADDEPIVESVQAETVEPEAAPAEAPAAPADAPVEAPAEAPAEEPAEAPAEEADEAPAEESSVEDETEIVLVADKEEAPAEEAPVFDGAANELTAGSAYYLVSGGNYVYVEGGALAVKDAKVSGSTVGTKNPEGKITASAGKGPNGGSVLTIGDATKYYIGIEDGAMALTTSEPMGEWFLSEGKLYFDSQGTKSYVTSWGGSFAVGAEAQAVAVTAYSADSDSATTPPTEDTTASTDAGYADAKGRLTDGYVVLAIGGTTYVSYDQNKIQTGSVTLNSDGTVTAAKGNYLVIEKSGEGYVMFAYDPPDKVDANKKFFELGADGATNPFPSESSGVWNIEPGKDGKLYFTAADGTLYYIAGVNGTTISATTDKDSAVNVSVYIGTTEPAGGPGGPGGPGSSSSTVDEDAPVIVAQMEAPHWINISKSGYETKQTLTLKASLPEGSKATSITFTWTFNGKTFEETIPANKAVDGVFTSTFIADIAGLGAGVYAVDCVVSCSDSADAPETSPDAPPSGDKPDAPPSGDKPDAPPSGDKPDTPPEGTVAPDGEGEEAVTWTETGAFAAGQDYIIGIKVGDTFYAMSNNGGVITALATDIAAPADSVIWTASSGNSGVGFVNGSYCLLYGADGFITTRASSNLAGNWSIANGILGYDQGGTKWYFGAISGDKFTCSKTDSSISVAYTVYTSGSASAGGSSSGDTHTIDAFTTNIILANGVKENSVITFSDVHETWDHVGTAVKDTILATEGFLPALIISTGDFNNDYITGNVDEYIKKCMEDIMGRIALQVGGIDTVWVSGNHDNGYAADYTNWNAGADLGIVLDDYFNEDAAISGTGIIFDTRSSGYQANADSSEAIDGLVVIGVNFEDVLALGGSANGRYSGPYDYGTGAEDGDSIYKHLQTALDSVAANYNGEVIIISSHAGLHTVGYDADSTSAGAKADTSIADYCINNSAAIVELVNSYVETYGLDVIWLFGHDHSKSEGEFVKLPGATIKSTVDYSQIASDPDAATKDIVLQFTYAHSGYITNTIGGKSYYSYITWDDDTITRTEKVSDGTNTELPFIAEGDNHATGTSLSFEIDRSTYLTVNVDPMSKADQEAVAPVMEAALPNGYTADNISFYDVDAVWVDPDGNETPADEDDIEAAGGLSFYLPYPADKDSYDFVVLHLVDEVNGTVEVLQPVKTDSGLKVTVNSLSPFAVAYKAIPTPANNPGSSGGGSNPGRGSNPGSRTQPAGRSAGASGKPSPKTGDDSSIVLWVSVLVLCAGATVAVLPRKKHNK